ncbi:MAG: FkbM family methyltransferase [Candidatus Competibacteraceae bacterium]
MIIWLLKLDIALMIVISQKILFLRFLNRISNPLRRLKKRFKVLLHQDLEYAFLLSRGVIHVGASLGQERQLYNRYNLSVIWIEALGDVYQQLVHNLRNFPKQQAFHALLTDQVDTVYDYFVASNNGMSSSILPPSGHKAVWQEISFATEQTMTSTTLVELVLKEHINVEDYDCLVMDTQGSELLVLQGAGELLNKFRFVLSEVADFEAYVNCCTVSSLGDYLQKAGFQEKMRQVYPVGENQNYYQVLYENLRYKKTGKLL